MRMGKLHIFDSAQTSETITRKLVTDGEGAEQATVLREPVKGVHILYAQIVPLTKRHGRKERVPRHRTSSGGERRQAVGGMTSHTALNNRGRRGVQTRGGTGGEKPIAGAVFGHRRGNASLFGRGGWKG